MLHSLLLSPSLPLSPTLPLSIPVSPPLFLSRPSQDDFVAFLMAYSSAPQYIKNPYLRGKLLEVMSLLIPKGRDQGFEFGGGNLATLFQEHEIAKKCMVKTLIQFYVDIEIMGREFDGARMFYSKFSYRHYMAELLMYVTKFDPYIKSLEGVVAEDEDAFVRFINMMLNDVIFCLDDAILKLQDIRSLETMVRGSGVEGRGSRVEVCGLRLAACGLRL
jgi:hypothetical protein